jgi:hypothetical protein
VSDWLDEFQMMGASLNEGEKSLMRFAMSKERERIIDLLENQIYRREYEGFFWKDTIDKVSIPELVARIRGEQK